jgi:hypothetical protein
MVVDHNRYLVSRVPVCALDHKITHVVKQVLQQVSGKAVGEP